MSKAKPRPQNKRVALKRTDTPRSARSRARKISVTVDERVLRAAEKDARRCGHTLSAHVTEALARDLRRRRIQALIDEYEADHGPIREDELARIRAQWQG
jgi:hypothetical protein